MHGSWKLPATPAATAGRTSHGLVVGGIPPPLDRLHQVEYCARLWRHAPVTTQLFEVENLGSLGCSPLLERVPWRCPEREDCYRSPLLERRLDQLADADLVLRSLASSHVGSRPYLGLDGKRGYSEAMESVPLTREAVIARLAAAEPDIRALGVAMLALFGSVARGAARPNSDVDLLVQFSPGQKSYGRFIALSDLLESLLQRRVELVTTEALSPFLGPRILAEAQDVLRAA